MRSSGCPRGATMATSKPASRREIASGTVDSQLQAAARSRRVGAAASGISALPREMPRQPVGRKARTYGKAHHRTKSRRRRHTDDIEPGQRRFEVLREQGGTLIRRDLALHRLIEEAKPRNV